ncbi:hypothetical protein D6T51_18285 [Salmonella enterica subsp. enterica serovar Muenchen]|nr:hypothetical protein [Salmonella enterica subsp. enterica serovar Muenchen]
MARTEKQFFVSGYAVNVRGYTRSAKANVFAMNREQAVIRAAAQLRWDGMTHFTALTVREIPSMAVSAKGGAQ